jgi:hypothetical protein
LASEEQEELRNYVKAGHWLALLHSRARRSLKASKASFTSGSGTSAGMAPSLIGRTAIGRTRPS